MEQAFGLKMLKKKRFLAFERFDKNALIREWRKRKEEIFFFNLDIYFYLNTPNKIKSVCFVRDKIEILFQKSKVVVPKIAPFYIMPTRGKGNCHLSLTQAFLTHTHTHTHTYIYIMPNT